MINFFFEDNLNNELVYSKYLSTIKDNAEYYMQLGYSKELSYAIQDYELDQCGILYAKENEKIVGFVMYNNKESLDRLVFDIQMEYYESNEIFTKLYNVVEDFAKSLGCVYINQKVLVKDQKIIDHLESINFKKEFCLMYKKV